ncbi:13583_t:CDS:2, partial [Racocetra fulgida]
MAECHEIIGDDESRVNKYFNIIQVSIDWMNNHNVYQWYYSEGTTYVEKIGIHALYDIWGMYRAWQRKDKLNVSKSVMVKLARTMMYVINLDIDNKIATRVDGTYNSTETTATLYGPWAFYAEFIPNWYNVVANANINKVNTGPEYIGALLWVKASRRRSLISPSNIE